VQKDSTDLLTLPQAAKKLGLEDPRGDKLRRVLIQREKEKGQPIMTRVKGETRTNVYVTMYALRRGCPELFATKSSLAKDLQDYLTGIDDKVRAAAAEHVTKFVDPRIDELWERDSKLANAIGNIEKKLGM
jgi:hypothetical protein